MTDKPVYEQIEGWIADLRAQREEAARAVQAAAERIDEIDNTLPELERMLQRAARQAMPQAEHQPPASDAASVVELRRTEHVQQVAGEMAEMLEGPFTQVQMEELLEEHGFSVNSSTLRKNLTEMVRAGQVYRVVVEGRGRRATVFERIPGAYPQE